jgi:selenophosphate synthetase-related protein
VLPLFTGAQCNKARTVTRPGLVACIDSLMESSKCELNHRVQQIR